jgi:hypothetical protein
MIYNKGNIPPLEEAIVPSRRVSVKYETAQIIAIISP